MTILLNDFSGTAATVYDNTTSAAGGDAFNETDSPAHTSGGSITVSSSHGRNALNVVVGATAGPERLGWQVNAANSTATQYAKFYFDPGDMVGTAWWCALRAMSATSAAQRMRVQIKPTGTIDFLDASNAVVWTSAACASGTVWRVEVSWGATTSADAQVKIFVEESDTPTQDSGILSGLNLGGPTQSMWFCQGVTVSNLNIKCIGPVGWSDTGWLGPVAGAPAPAFDVHLGTGIPTSIGLTVSQRWDNATDRSGQIVVSTTSDLATSPITGPTTTFDELGYAKMQVSGLTPDTKYYGGVKIDGVLDAGGRFSFTTSPTPGTAKSFGWFFGSCRWDNGGEEAFTAMSDAMDNGPVMQPIAFLSDMGDNGYPDYGYPGGQDATEENVLAMYANQAKWSSVPTLMVKCPYDFINDNHDAGGPNSDKNGAWKVPVQAGFKRAIPHRDLPSSMGSLYHSFEWGRVRFIVPDNRSERDAYDAPNGPEKRMWSQEQEDWFIDQCKSWPWAICVLGAMYARQDAATGDRWGSYPDQWKRLNDRMNANDVLRRIVWLFGDRHALCADLGVSATTRGIPQAGGAPFEQGSVDLPNNEPWDVGGGTAYYNPTPNAVMRAFGEGAVTDSGGPTITFNYIGRTTDGVLRVAMTKVLDVSRRPLFRGLVSDPSLGIITMRSGPTF